MEPIKKIRLSDSVINAIKKKIAKDNFQPGDKFYSENELSRQLQVSRSSIREAIRILEATGYVTVKQGKGIFVTDFDSQNLKPFISWLKSNEQHIFDHFEIRLIIEPKAAAIAAQKADTDDIRKIEEVLAEFDLHAERKEITEIIKTDRIFHRLIAKSTKNSTLYVLINSLTTSLPKGWISSLHTPGRIDKTTHEHRDILKAITAKDNERAEGAMIRHLENALSDIKAHMGSVPH